MTAVRGDVLLEVAKSSTESIEKVEQSAIWRIKKIFEMRAQSGGIQTTEASILATVSFA